MPTPVHGSCGLADEEKKLRGWEYEAEEAEEVSSIVVEEKKTRRRGRVPLGI